MSKLVIVYQGGEVEICYVKDYEIKDEHLLVYKGDEAPRSISLDSIDRIDVEKLNMANFTIEFEIGGYCNMSKSISVVDTPRCCVRCKFPQPASYYINEGYFCSCNNRKIDHIEEKPDWCPLREVPEKLNAEHYLDDNAEAYCDGYNSCIDDILKKSIGSSISQVKEVKNDPKGKKVTETIFSGADMVIPMSSVQHIEKHMKDGVLDGITIITDKTKWNSEHSTWENPIYLSSYDNHAESFLKAFCTYIAESDGMI